jgi:hypothetical protein
MRSIPEAHFSRVRALVAAAVGALACVLVAGVLLQHPKGIALLDLLGATHYRWDLPLLHETLGAAAWRGAVGGLVVYLLVLAARFRRPPRTNRRGAPVLADPVATSSSAIVAFVWFAVNTALAAMIGAASGWAVALLLIIHQPFGVLKEMESQMAEWLRYGAAAGAAAGLLCGIGRLWPFRSFLGAMAFSAACGLVALGLIWPILGYNTAKSWSAIGVIAGAVAGAVVCPKWVRANGA